MGTARSVLSGGCRGAAILGAIGFTLGFVGPIVFMPDANQGPLLGIFFTGPLGVILGATIGAFSGWRRAARGDALEPRQTNLSRTLDDAPAFTMPRRPGRSHPR